MNKLQMAVADGSKPPQQPHVPAWRRLGLKLKYANDTAKQPSTPLQPFPSDSSPIANSNSTVTTAPYRKGDEPPSKKRRTSPESHHASRHDAQLIANGLSSQRRSGQRESLANDEGSAARPFVETEPIAASQEVA